MTLLFQDDVGGLEIKLNDGSYIKADPIDETVLVNIADLLQFWTNGVLKSTPHRISTPTDTKQRSSVRRSIAFFVHPSEHLPVMFDVEKGGTRNPQECSVELRDFSLSQLEKMTVGDYLSAHFGKNYSKPAPSR